MASWADTLALRLGYVKAAKAPSSPPFMRDVAWLGSLQPPDLSVTENQLRAYSSVSWVYFAVSRIAESCAQAELQVLRRIGEETEEVFDHPLEQLLRKPNPKLSRFRLMEGTIGALELTGNAYWWLNLVGGVPVEIWPLRPDRVKPIPHATEYVSGYLYQVGGREYRLPPESIVHFQRWHPVRDYVGLSPIEAAARAMQTDVDSAKWNASFFSTNNAVPATAVILPASLDNVAYEALRKEWKEKYGGPDKSFRTAFLRGEGIEVKQMGLSQGDMQFIEGREWNREEILMLFGVPLGKWSENATEANAVVADATFLSDTIWPKLVRIADQVTLDLLQPFYGDDLMSQYKDIRPKNRQLEMLEFDRAAKVMSINELRARYWNLGPLEEGETSGDDIAPAYRINPVENLEEMDAGGGASPSQRALQNGHRKTLTDLLQPQVKSNGEAKAKRVRRTIKEPVRDAEGRIVRVMERHEEWVE